MDGVERGLTPLTLNDLAAGEHQVTIKAERSVLRRTVTLTAGETLSLVMSPVEASAPAPGWLHVKSPIVLQLWEGGQVIGTSESQKLMLPAGNHA